MTVKISRRRLLAGTAALGLSGSILSMHPGALHAQDSQSVRRNLALLIAVNDYPELGERANLLGPNNDVDLVREFFLAHPSLRFEPDDIRVLADGIEAVGLPNLSNIVSELDRLADTAGEGDFVYVHFSGHGAQQVAADPSTEPDGMDEVFLPSDTGAWDEERQENPNVLRDFLIGEHLQRIRDKGAFVWAVFDCCHSGTMTRAIDIQDEVERKLDNDVLGIPDDVVAAAAAAGAAAWRGTDPRQGRSGIVGEIGQDEPGATRSLSGDGSAPAGGMVAFFASQTVETTPEMLLPRGSRDARQLGLFTHTLFSRLAENPNVTYRQLGQGILQAYAAENRTRPTPLFEGLLDAPVFGTFASALVVQWPIRHEGNSIEVAAGSLHRLAPGTKLAIVPLAGSPDAETLGFLEVSATMTMRSRLRPIEHEGLPRLLPNQIPRGAYARLAETVVDFEMTVARPGSSRLSAQDLEAANALLEEIVADRTRPMNIRLVDAGESADLNLVVMSERDAHELTEPGATPAAFSGSAETPVLWLLPPSRELSLEPGRRPPSVALFDRHSPNGRAVINESAREDLAHNLLMVFRALSLARLSGVADARLNGFDIRFRLERAPSFEAETLEEGRVPVVHPDDEMFIEATNASGRPVDINILYIGSDYSITHIMAERLHPGSSIPEAEQGLFYFTPDSFGIERMVVVLTEAEPMSALHDLHFLAQDGVRTRAAGSGGDGLMGMLSDLGLAAPTRSVATRRNRSSATNTALMIMPVENLPREN